MFITGKPALKGCAICVVDTSVLRFISPDADRMDSTPYPVVWSSAPGVTRFLDLAGTDFPVLQQAGNIKCANRIVVFYDREADLISERVEAVHYETCSGSTEKLVPSFTSTVFLGKRTPSLPFRSSW